MGRHDHQGARSRRRTRSLQARIQSWLEEMLGNLPPGADDPDEHGRVLLGLHAALDVFTWKLLRRDLHLPRAETERVMADTVMAVLAGSTTATRKAGKTR